MKNFPVFAHLWAVFPLILANVAGGCNEHPTALFVFGDSLFDAGNNNYIETVPEFQANFWPYGETFFGFATGRVTNGRTIPDFICEHAKLPLIPPYLQLGFRDYDYGVNFASSGAGVLVETHRGRVICLKTQLSYFDNVTKLIRHKLGSQEVAGQFLSSAVYLVSVGGNDYFDAFSKNSSSFHSPGYLEELVSTVISNLLNAIREIYSKGGRKFGFLNLSPMGCVPAIAAREPERKYACAEELTQAAKLHNRALSLALQGLKLELDGFEYSIHNFYASFSERSDNPSKYGFMEARTACCGSGRYRGTNSCGGKRSEMEAYELCEDPSEFLYFDSVHPTEKAYEQLAELFWSGSSDITGPTNLKSLFQMGRESCGFGISSH